MKMDRKKKDSTPHNAIIRILENHQPIKDSILGIIWDLKHLEIEIKHTKISYIINKTDDPAEIADYILDTSSKEKRAKLKALLKKNRSGRPRSKEYDTLRQAKTIVLGKNLHVWKQELGIDRATYELQRFQILKGLYENQGKANRAIFDRMIEELNILWRVMKSFQKLAKEAQKKNDTLILNTIRMVFRDEANYYIKGNKKQGNIIKWATIRKRESVFWEYVESDCKANVPATFYDRDKPTGICLIAKKIHDIFYQPHRMITFSTNRLRALLKVSLLMDKYDIGLNELRGINPLSLDAQKLRQIAAKPIKGRQNTRVDSKSSSREQNPISNKAEEVHRTDIEKSIDTLRSRFMLREELLEQLQDI